MKKAVKDGFSAYHGYMNALRRKGEEALRYARDRGKRIMILAGRPYHADPETTTV